ncbi:hypothetical protein, partial [Stenotrophomonas sp. Ste71]|uniref:hypothetical protein n=1 Tax=Stenotrophomonas sp. Ste71 TaxID=2926027 RepID=UPI0021188A67
ARQGPQAALCTPPNERKRPGTGDAAFLNCSLNETSPIHNALRYIHGFARVDVPSKPRPLRWAPPVTAP